MAVEFLGLFLSLGWGKKNSYLRFYRLDVQLVPFIYLFCKNNPFVFTLEYTKHFGGPIVNITKRKMFLKARICLLLPRPAPSSPGGNHPDSCWPTLPLFLFENTGAGAQAAGGSCCPILDCPGSEPVSGSRLRLPAVDQVVGSPRMNE